MRSPNRSPFGREFEISKFRSSGRVNLAESGYSDYLLTVRYVLQGPRRCRTALRRKSTANIDRALNDHAFRASLEKIGFPVFRQRSANAIAQFIDADRARWSGVIKTQNITGLIR